MGDGISDGKRARARRIGLAALAAILVAPSGAAELRVERGLQDYVVLQRDGSNRATVEFSGTCALTEPASLEASLERAGQVGQVLDWRPCGESMDGSFRGRIQQIPAGGPYDVRLRLSSRGEVVETGLVREILVGDLWVLAGQSNMQGLGRLSNAETPSRYVHVFDMADRWLVAEEPLHWLAESVDVVHSGPPGDDLEARRTRERATRSLGSGLGLPFAKAMVERTGIPVGLIPCAHGGTSLKQWSPDLAHLGGESLYGSMLRRHGAAGGRVRGMLWYQGESDALDVTGSANYEREFRRFVPAIRQDFQQPSLPFYYVQLGRCVPADQSNAWTNVRMAQLRCESLLREPVGMVAAVDLPLSDPIHLSTEGLRTVGRRLALRATRDLLVDPSIAPGPRPTLMRVDPGPPLRIVVTFSGANGGLSSEGPVTGFSVRDPDGEDLRLVFAQFVDPAMRNEIVIECQVGWAMTKLPDDAELHYGWGGDPRCNLVDDAGFAVPAFGPRKIPSRGR